jgi:hypothetical protein
VKGIVTFSKNYLDNRILHHKIGRTNGIRDYVDTKQITYAGKKLKSADDFNSILQQKLLEDEPFMLARFGSTELINMRNFDFNISSKIEGSFDQLCRLSGFFPRELALGYKFTNIMKQAISEIDAMGIWFLQFEEYYIKRYMPKCEDIAYLLDIEPWSSPSNPWSKALEGKKVLVIHPFVETIQSQYAKRDLLFPGTDILPEFQLNTLKAVQTIAGENDNRFVNWFEALDYMYTEAMKIEFDIAIVGCGAYGLPLAAKLKNSGKKAIHLGGATQILFGIKGKRWEESVEFEYIEKYFNSAWVYPNSKETPKSAKSVEGGCYW